MTPPLPGEQTSEPSPLLSMDCDLVRNVQVDLKAQLGKTSLTMRELLELKTGSVIPLDQSMNAPIALQLNGAIVALGDIVAVGDRFGVRITTISDRA